jgi:hypothetical protein
MIKVNKVEIMNQDYLDCVGGYEAEEVRKIIHQSTSLSGIHRNSEIIMTADFQDLFGHDLSLDDAVRLFGVSSIGTNQYVDSQPKTEDVHFLNPIINENSKLFRNGILKAIRQNALEVSGQLRYSYLSDHEAMQRGMNLAALQKLRKIKDKIVQIYQKHGGYENSLKRAMLTGTGNEYNNHVPVSVDNVGIYADQSEYDILNSPYSPFDIWDTLPAHTKDFMLAMDKTLKPVTGLFVTGNGKSGATTLSGNIPQQGEFVTGEESQHEKQGTAPIAIPPKEDKNFIEQTTDWISENPIASLLIAGTVISGGILIKKYFDEQRVKKRSGLQGLTRAVCGNKKHTGRGAARKRRAKAKVSFMKPL